MPRRTAQEIRDILAKDKQLFPGQSVSWTTTIGGKRFGCIVDTPDHVMAKAHFMVVASNGKHELDAITLKAEPTVRDPVRQDVIETYGPFCDKCHKAPCGCIQDAVRKMNEAFLDMVNEALP